LSPSSGFWRRSPFPTSSASSSDNAEYSTYLAAPVAPNGTLSGDKQNWLAVSTGFDTIGWFPEGEVYYNYNVVTEGGCPVAAMPCTQYTVEGESDIDNDTTINTWGYVHAAVGGAGIPSLSGKCVATGVYNGVTQSPDLLNTTGPCTMDDGQNFF
jgi:hypothetical protein